MIYIYGIYKIYTTDTHVETYICTSICTLAYTYMYIRRNTQVYIRVFH